MLITPWSDAPRRHSPRISVETLCTEVHDLATQHSIVTDLSTDGLRLHRPLGGRIPRHVGLEFEIPEVDEVMWGIGEVCFDEVQRAPVGSPHSLGGLVRSTGFRLVHAAERHRKMLREFVLDYWCDFEADDEPVVSDDNRGHRPVSAAGSHVARSASYFSIASCYRYG